MNSDVSQLSGATVLVTGATGFTGSVLVKKLIEQGAVVHAIARPSSNIDAFKDLPIRWFRGDVFDEATIRDAVKGVAYIFHVAAAYRAAKIEDEDYRRVHVLSTELLAKAALKEPGFKRFVHVSTIGVHGHIDEPPADESYRFAPGDVYQRTKAEAELWLHDFARINRLPYTVIRPAAILGPRDKRLLKIFRMATKPFVPVLGFGKCLYHLIHVEDLAEALMLAAIHPRAAGEVFICGNEKPSSLFDMVRTVGKLYGKQPKFVRLPVAPFFLAGALCEVICKPLGIEPPIYRRRVAFYTKDRSFDTRKIRDLLGFRPRPNEEGIEDTARWYKENRWVNS